MGNSIHFRHTNGCSWESVKVFETENVSTWGGLEPPTFGFMLNALTYWAIRARHLLSHVVEYWLWRYRYFWSKDNIWNVNCARVTTFIDTGTGVLGKVSKSLRQKMSWPEGDSNPQPVKTGEIMVGIEDKTNKVEVWSVFRAWMSNCIP